jgi:hypothetical protein
MPKNPQKSGKMREKMEKNPQKFAKIPKNSHFFEINILLN